MVSCVLLTLFHVNQDIQVQVQVPRVAMDVSISGRTIQVKEAGLSPMINVSFSVDGYAPEGKSIKLGNVKSIDLPYYHGYLAEEGAVVETSATVTVDTGSGSSSSSNYALPLIIGASIFTVGGAGLVLFNKKSQQKTPEESVSNNFVVA